MCSGDFDSPVKYLMNQVTYHQVNKQLNIGSVGSSAPNRLCTCNDQGNDLKMPLVNYLLEEWAQLLSAQKSSICKRHLRPMVSIMGLAAEVVAGVEMVVVTASPAQELVQP